MSGLQAGADGRGWPVWPPCSQDAAGTCSLPRSQAGLARDERVLGGGGRMRGAGFPDGRPASPSSAVWPQAPGSGRPHSSRPVLGGRVGEAGSWFPPHAFLAAAAGAPTPRHRRRHRAVSPQPLWKRILGSPGWEWLSPVAPRPPAPASKVPARRAALGRLRQTSNPVCRPVPCLGAARSLGSAQSVEGRAWWAVGRMASPGCGVAVDRALLTRSRLPPARLGWSVCPGCPGAVGGAQRHPASVCLIVRPAPSTAPFPRAGGQGTGSPRQVRGAPLPGRLAAPPLPELADGSRAGSWLGARLPPAQPIKLAIKVAEERPRGLTPWWRAVSHLALGSWGDPDPPMNRTGLYPL